MSVRRLRGLKRLVFDAIDGTTRLVERTHRRTAERVAGALGAVPEVREVARSVDAVHGLGASFAYGSVRAVTRGIDLVTELPFEVLEAARVELPERALATPMDSRAPRTLAWWLDAVEGFVAGAVGDHLAERSNPLAPDMSLRHEGRVVPVERTALGAAYPEASRHVVVFVHGLSCTEWAWSLDAEERWGDPRMSYGVALRRDLGATPLYLRYNTGLHVSENGARLSDLLTRLMVEWPVPVERLTLVGHSMGGLVSRSAALQGAEGGAWVGRLKELVSIGSPHHGAPLEKGAHLLSRVLRGIPTPGTEVPGELLEIRSAGIRDLRHGSLLESEWPASEAWLEDPRTLPTLVPGVTYAFLASTLTHDPEHPVGRLLGDLLVRVESASGAHPEHARRIPFHEGEVLGGISHLSLANHPAVYERLLRVLRAAAGSGTG